MGNNNPVVPINNLVSPDTAAEILGVCKETLSVWRCVGRVNLSYVKVGRKVMYRPEDIQSFIESRTFAQTA